MSTQVGSIHYDLGLDTSKFDRGSKRAQSRLESLRPTFKKMAVGGAVATGAIVAGIGKVVNEARKAQDIESLFSLAFGNMKEDAQDVANSFSEEFGRSESRIKDSLARVAFQFDASTDLAQEDMLRLTESMLPAAEGLALLDNNVESGTDVMQAFSDALAGQNQQLGRMIGGYREADIEQKAINEGIIEQGEELTSTKRALALHKLFMDRTTKSQEKMAQENRGATDKVVQFKDAMRDFQEKAGKPFLNGLSSILSTITPVIRKIGEWMQQNPGFVKAITIATLALTSFVAVAGALGLALLAISGPALLITGLVAGLGAAIVLWFKKSEDPMATMKRLWDSIKNAAIGAWQWFKQNLLPVLKDLSDEMKRQLLPALKDLWNTIRFNIIPTIQSLGGNTDNSRQKFQRIADFIKIYVIPAMKFMINVIRTKIRIIAAIIRVTQRWQRKVNNALQRIRSFFEPMKNVVQGVRDAWLGAFGDMIGKIQSAIGWVRELLGLQRESLNLTPQQQQRAQQIGRNVFPGLQKGGIAPGGMALVGERGPELVNLPKGSRVFSNEESRRMSSGDTHIIQNIEQKHISDPTAWARKIAFELER